MNIGQLKKIIADLPDDMLVVVEGSDHSYFEGFAGEVGAEIHRNKRGRVEHIGEYHKGYEVSEGAKVENVLAVGCG